MKKQLGMLLLASALVLSACANTAQKKNAAGGNESASLEKKEEKAQMVATFYPVYEFTKEIAGDMADVKLLIPAGTEVHGYEPSAKDIADIQDADVFVYEDPNMEMWVPDVLKSMGKADADVIQATDGLILLPGSGHDEHDHDADRDEHDHDADHDEHDHDADHDAHDHDHEGHHHEFDPHLWLSPYRAQFLVKNIRDGLIKKYPAYAEQFTKNADAYLSKLSALDASYQEAFSAAKQRYFVTQHTAFAYLALDYGLKQVSITGLSADTDPTISRLEELSEYIQKYGIRYIYFEENAKASVAETLAKETGAKLLVLNPLESLTKEEMEAGDSYISVMERNLESLKIATSEEGGEILPEGAKEGEDASKTVHNGYFSDADVKDRTLSDYEGEWQSVYPLLLDGTLDQVFDYKAKMKGGKTAEEYKAYYDAGYRTDVEKIAISGDSISFTSGGKTETYAYQYAGYRILNYAKGNRGVRFLFEAKDANAGRFRYVQFSDHNIAPVKAEHFHIFFGGDSQEAVLEELENWPTYYDASLSGIEVAQHMIAH